MNTLYLISTPFRSYKRHAWTGGDAPPRGRRRSDPEYRALVAAFFREQVADCGGLDLWKVAGASVLDRARIFWRRASLDAWRTLQKAEAEFPRFCHLRIGARFRWRTLRGAGDVLEKTGESTFRNITTRGPSRPLGDSAFTAEHAVHVI